MYNVVDHKNMTYLKYNQLIATIHINLMVFIALIDISCRSIKFQLNL